MSAASSWKSVGRERSKWPMTPVEDAVAQVLSQCSALGSETVDLCAEGGPSALLGRVLAEDVRAPEALPAFDASIMDGFSLSSAAVKKACESAKGPFCEFEVVPWSVTAGDDPGGRSVAGVGASGRPLAAYITTGAPLPPGADVVVPVEECERLELDLKDEDVVKGLALAVAAAAGGAAGRGDNESRPRTLIRIAVSLLSAEYCDAGRWVRPAGSDVTKGELVLASGTELCPAEVGMLAHVGCTLVAVGRRPRVGILSTGDEILPANVGSTGLGRGKIRDSNGPMLVAAAAAAGAEAVFLGRVADDEKGLLETMRKAVQGREKCDIVITSGGVSMGAKDYVKSVISGAELKGEIGFGRLEMKPGKPTVFATIPCGNNGDGGENGDASGEKGRKGRCLFFGLPGNPVSSLVSFSLVVEPAIRRMGGSPLPSCGPPRVSCRLSSKLRCDPVRREYHRAALKWRRRGRGAGSPGEFEATSTGMQRSSRILSLRSASALLCLPKTAGALPAGTTVPALLLRRGKDLLLAPDAKEMACNTEWDWTLPTAPHTDEGNAATAAFEAKKKKKKENEVVGGQKEDGSEGDGEEEEDDTLPSCPCCRAKALMGPGGEGGKKKSKGGDTKGDVPPPYSGGDAAAPGDLVRIGVVTCSDRASKGRYKDKGGPAVLRCVSSILTSAWQAEPIRVVPDEEKAICSAISDLCDRCGCDLVVTTGGTGITPRDVTPEATATACDRVFPGFGEAMRSVSLRFTRTAVMSRQTAGSRGRSFVLNLPGNPSAVHQTLPAIADQVFTAVATLSGKYATVSAACERAAGGGGKEQKEGGDLPSLPPTASSSSGFPAVVAVSAPIKMWQVDAVNLEWMKKGFTSKTKAAMHAIAKARVRRSPHRQPLSIQSASRPPFHHHTISLTITDIPFRPRTRPQFGRQRGGATGRR